MNSWSFPIYHLALPPKISCDKPPFHHVFKLLNANNGQESRIRPPGYHPLLFFAAFQVFQFFFHSLFSFGQAFPWPPKWLCKTHLKSLRGGSASRIWKPTEISATCHKIRPCVFFFRTSERPSAEKQTHPFSCGVFLWMQCCQSVSCTQSFAWTLTWSSTCSRSPKHVSITWLHIFLCRWMIEWEGRTKKTMGYPEEKHCQATNSTPGMAFFASFSFSFGTFGSFGSCSLAIREMGDKDLSFVRFSATRFCLDSLGTLVPSPES